MLYTHLRFYYFSHVRLTAASTWMYCCYTAAAAAVAIAHAFLFYSAIADTLTLTIFLVHAQLLDAWKNGAPHTAIAKHTQTHTEAHSHDVRCTKTVTSPCIEDQTICSCVLKKKKKTNIRFDIRVVRWHVLFRLLRRADDRRTTTIAKKRRTRNPIHIQTHAVWCKETENNKWNEKNKQTTLYELKTTKLEWEEKKNMQSIATYIASTSLWMSVRDHTDLNGQATHVHNIRFSVGAFVFFFYLFLLSQCVSGIRCGTIGR